MNMEASTWNGWVARLERARLLPGRTSRLERVPQGQVLSFAPPVHRSLHPWSVDVRWGAEDCHEARIAVAGLVNGLPPDVEGVLAGKEQATTLDEAWMPLRSLRRGLAEEPPHVKLFFEARGVRLSEGETGPQRHLAASDVWLARARLSYKAEVTAVDASGTSGQIVDYAVTYDTATLEARGASARVVRGANFPEKQRPTLAERLMGLYQDDGEDRLRVCSIYFLSPPEPKNAVPDAAWQVFTRHDLFWNVRHGARVEMPKQPPKPIRFFSGLAAGLGDMIINQNLALSNDLAQRIGAAVANDAPEGQWSIA